MRGDGRIFTRKGSSYFWLSYYHNGKEVREPARHTRTGNKIEATDANRREAEKSLRHRLGEIAAERHGGPSFIGPAQQRVTIDDLLDALEADYKLRDKDSPQFRAHLKRIRQQFGSWRAVDLTAEAVDRYISEEIEGEKAPATINRRTQLLAQAYKLAMERKRLSSAPHIRHLSEKGNARQGFFADAEFHSVVENLPAYLRDFVRFAYLTGWRKGEIASLRWQDVEGDVVRLRAENSKNGEARMVTLDGDLAEIIKRRTDARKVVTQTGFLLAELVFHNAGFPIMDFRKAWATGCVMAGLGKLVCPTCNQEGAAHICETCKAPTRYNGKLFHDFRRSAVRNMVRAGVPERVAMTISGHKTRSIFDRYNIVSEADLRNAMQRTQEYLVTAAQGEKRAATMPKRPQ